MGTLWCIGTFAFAMPFDVAVEANGDEIFNEEPCVGKTFQIFLRGGCNLAFGGTKIRIFKSKSDTWARTRSE